MSGYKQIALAGAASIALLSLSAATHAQSTDLDCSKCVQAKELDSEAVTTYKIRDQAVTTSKLASDAVSGAKIKNGAITKNKIADKAVGGTQINPTQVQKRVDGTCTVGSFITAVAKNGTVTCETGSFGDHNNRSGTDALASNTDGYFNTASGVEALYSNTSGGANTAAGVRALVNNVDGYQNTASGVNVLFNNTSGYDNTGSGMNVLVSNTTGSENTAYGAFSLGDNDTGVDNIAIGAYAGRNITGSYNIAIGHDGVEAEDSTIRIGDADQQRTFVSGISGVMTGINDAVTVVIDSNGQLGTVSSSRRYKEEISDMGDASEGLLRLNPVTFHYKQAYENGARPLEYGLIAEEVAEVFPELVVFNDENQPETVKYRLLSSLLLNELQKQHTELNGQTADIAELREQVAELSQLVEQIAALD